MDIAERRLPQDGRATIRIGDGEVDVRISSVPTTHGERIVMRLLDKTTKVFTIGEIGLAPQNLGILREYLDYSHGIILVTGPTGSGKTTTLYAAMNEVDTTQKNVLTIEDPVEYSLPGISQVQVNVKKGLTFATGLRSFLRQDPDVMMVGEIRDLETAEVAIRAALTGHLVFSTVHTNDAAFDDHADGRPGRRAVPRRELGRARDRAAPRAHDLQALPVVRADQRRSGPRN